MNKNIVNVFFIKTAADYAEKNVHIRGCFLHG